MEQKPLRATKKEASGSKNRKKRLFKPCRPASHPGEEKVENLALDQACRKGMDITFGPSTKRHGFCLAKTDKTESKGDRIMT